MKLIGDVTPIDANCNDNATTQNDSTAARLSIKVAPLDLAMAPIWPLSQGHVMC